jgi:uncharacterized protein
MLFSRREPLSPINRLKQMLWPRRGWARAARYAWLRLCRLQGSPHAIALGVSAGIFATFVPILGIQMALAAGLAYALRGNLVGALAGTFVGTPITYPLMWFGSYRLGGWMMGHDPSRLKLGLDRLWSIMLYGFRGDTNQAADVLLPIVLPLLIGSLVLGLAAGLAAYYTLLHVLGRLQDRRRAQLAHCAVARMVVAA